MNDGQRVVVDCQPERNFEAEAEADEHFAQKPERLTVKRKQREHPGTLKKWHKPSVAGSKFCACQLRFREYVEPEILVTLTRTQKRELRKKLRQTKQGKQTWTLMVKAGL